MSSRRLIAGAAVLLGWIWAGPSIAEPQEVLIGTFQLRPSSAAPASAQPPGTNSRTAPLAAPQAPSQIRADDQPLPSQLLGAAMAMLGAGDRSGAQRQLELLVASHPDTVESGHARRYLGQIYAAVTTAAPPAIETAPRTAEPGPLARAEPRSPAPNDGWQTEVRRSPGIEERFAIEVPDRIFFGAGAAELGTRARNVLATQAGWLVRHAGVDVIVEGHADEPGSADENAALSLQRAEAVRDRLIAEGVDAARIKAVAKGRRERIAECDDPDCAAQNRRAITVAMPGSGPAIGPVAAAPRPSRPLAGEALPGAIIRTSGGDPSER